MWGAFPKSLLFVDTDSVPYLPVVAVSTLNAVSRKVHVGLSLEEIPAYLPFQLYAQTLKCMLQHVWRSKDNFRHAVLFFHLVCHGHQTRAVGLGGKHLYPPSHCAGIYLDSLNGPRFSVPLITCYFSFWICHYFNSIIPHPIPPLPPLYL